MLAVEIEKNLKELLLGKVTATGEKVTNITLDFITLEQSDFTIELEEIEKHITINNDVSISELLKISQLILGEC